MLNGQKMLSSVSHTENVNFALNKNTKQNNKKSMHHRGNHSAERGASIAALSRDQAPYSLSLHPQPLKRADEREKPTLPGTSTTNPSNNNNTKRQKIPPQPFDENEKEKEHRQTIISLLAMECHNGCCCPRATGITVCLSGIPHIRKV